MDLRGFLADLEKTGNLVKHGKASTDCEIADIIFKSTKPVLFDGLGDYRLVAGVCMDRDLIARYMGIKKEEMLVRIAKALDHPINPVVVSGNAPCQEVEEKEVDLNKLPILKHYKKDDGFYITAGVVIVKNPDGSQNMAYHRMKRIDKDRLTARICERDTFKCMQAKGGETEVAICLGNTPSVLIAASTSLKGMDETKIAGALEGKPLKMVKCKTVDINVPADCEIVLEGKITKEMFEEGMFVDMTGTYDGLRQQPVVKISKITHRKDPIYQALVPGRTEHRLLMGMPKEPTIYKAVKEVVDCVNVNLTPGGCSWLSAVVQIKKKGPDDGKKAIEAAFKGHASMKHVTVVDDDIDLFDPNDVEWAITTRFQAHKNLYLFPGAPGSSLDPSAEEVPGSDRRQTTKWGIDATIPWGGKKEDFLRAAQLQG